MEEYIKELTGLKVEAKAIKEAMGTCITYQIEGCEMPIITEGSSDGCVDIKIKIDPIVLLSYFEEKIKPINDKIKVLENALKVASDVVKKHIESNMETKDEIHDKQ